MRIAITTEFLHGPDRYYVGEIRELEPALAGYFVNQGWAANVDAPIRREPATLDIQNARANVKDSNG